MEDLDNLEKLSKLRDKGIIDEQEYKNIKNNIVNKNILVIDMPKSGVAYVLLAWFLGIFGAHNLYAGYIKRAIVQLLLTLFSWMLFFIPLVIVQIWVLGDMFLINKDANGVPFIGDKLMIMIIRIAALIFYVLGYVFGAMSFLVNYYWTTPPVIISSMFY